MSEFDDVLPMVDQMLASGREMLSRFDRSYVHGAHLSTEDLFGSLYVWLMCHWDDFPQDQMATMTAAAIVERYRKPVPIPEV